jgi:branched-chain amino acid transport system ATP-binding protein
MHMEGIDFVATPSHRIVELGIAHVPENRHLFPHMTVEDNLRMGGFVPQAIAQVGCRNAHLCAVVPWMSLR